MIKGFYFIYNLTNGINYSNNLPHKLSNYLSLISLKTGVFFHRKTVPCGLYTLLFLRNSAIHVAIFRLH